MKVRITSEQLRPGMFLTGFDGPWLQHPFWRRRFLLSAEDVATIRASDVDGIFIDDAEGVRPEPPASRIGAMAASGAAASPEMSVSARLKAQAAPPPRSEEERAALIVQRSKRAVMEMFAEARLGRAVETRGLEPLVDEIAESVARDATAMIKVTRLKEKNEYTYMHSVAVCALMINLSRQLGLPESGVHDIGMAGLLHDIGKMAVPDSILNKPGPLDPVEFDLVRGHPAAGHDMLRAAPHVPAVALDVCLHHHERIDGKGYPHGLKGDAISLYARMGAICDVYDAVTSNRPYKAPWSPADALEQMRGWEGHFDTDVLQSFIRSIGIYPPGTLVRLRTNRLAIVRNCPAWSPTLPEVRAFYDCRAREFLKLDDLTVSDNLAGDNIVGLEEGTGWFGPAWPLMLDALRAGRLAEAQALLAPSTERRRA